MTKPEYQPEINYRYHYISEHTLVGWNDDLDVQYRTYTITSGQYSINLSHEQLQELRLMLDAHDTRQAYAENEEF